MNTRVRHTRNNDDQGIAAAGAVDQDRLWRRHMEMAKIGAIPGNGVNRQALTKKDIAARRLLIAWAEVCGFSIGIDAIGNIFIRRQGRDPNAAPALHINRKDTRKPVSAAFQTTAVAVSHTSSASVRHRLSVDLLSK